MVLIKTSDCITNYSSKFDQSLSSFLSAIATPAPPSSSQLCRYFPACKKMECPFYHPKVRIFIFPKIIKISEKFSILRPGRALAN